GRCEAIGATDDECDRGPVLGAPALEVAGEWRTAETFAVLVEDRDGGALGQHIGDGDRFFEPAPVGVVGAAFADLDHIDGLETDAATGVGRALAIALGEVPLGTLLQPADGGDHDAHGSRRRGSVSSPGVPATAGASTSFRADRRRALRAGRR